MSAIDYIEPIGSTQKDALDYPVVRFLPLRILQRHYTKMPELYIPFFMVCLTI